MTNDDFVKEPPIKDFKIRVTLLGGVLMVASFVAAVLFEHEAPGDMLAMVAAILLGTPLLGRAVKDLWHGRRSFNELVALAVLAAFAMGRPDGNEDLISGYHQSAAIAFFMILADLIESQTAVRAQASIEELVKITPTRAYRIEDGVEAEVEARMLRPGNIVRVRPGDNIPADGRVTHGASTVNQANITGESLPAEKVENDEVFSGTINLTGVIDVEVTKAGEDTTLGRVKQMILQAEATRIPIVRMINHYAGWYTPTILMITAIVWYLAHLNKLANPEQRAITMLVVACPCALILATPTAMVAALTAATRLGVLVKHVVTLEAARNLTAIMFDKTGTLTTGELEVAKLAPAEGVAGADLLATAAALEQGSRHPVARAITSVARKARLNIAAATDFHEAAGRGVKGKIEGKSVAVGRPNWLAAEESGQSIDPQVKATIDAAQNSPDAKGLSTLFVMRDEQLMGWIGLADNARAGAADAMDQLREIGLKRLIIVTGDRESVAKRVAGQMHTEYKAEVLPQEKLEMVDQLKQKGHRVAVVGDGVNDAPALAAGDISIAMGAAGSDVAIHQASIALMNNNLNRIPFLIKLSRTTFRVVTQNLMIGGLFIVVGELMAAANLFGPITAAFVLVVSGLVVIFNSARLVRSGEEIEMAESQALEQGSSSPPQVPEPSAEMANPAVATTV